MRDSSLSACTQAVIAAEVGHLELAYDYFAEAALMDLDNLEHNTRDGLHIASLAGTWIVAVAGFGGMRDHDGVLSFTPRLPQRLTRLAFGMCFRGRRLRVEVTHEQARYSLLEGSPLEVTHHGDAITVTADRPVSCPIPALAAKATPTQPHGRSPAPRRAMQPHGRSPGPDAPPVPAFCGSRLARCHRSLNTAAASGERSSAEEMTDVGPESTVAGLGEEELAVLRQVGEHWGRALAGRRASLRGLPVDPALHRFPRSVEVGRRSRFAAVDFVETDDPAELVATPHASAGRSRSGRAASMWRRVVLGSPLNSSAVVHERMRKLVALAVLSSDALSSVAYGPEAMLAVLALAGSSALGLSLGISVAIVVLMLAVGLSYRQLIRAYPHGGGSYIVADRNLGELPALIAAAGLLIDYVLTVAVSISAGVAAITSAIPGLGDARVALGLSAIAICWPATCAACARPARSSPRRRTRSCWASQC